jgi:hypothetical protein
MKMNKLNTTPRQVRAELKKRKLPYDVLKCSGCWYVVGGDAHEWYSSSLEAFDFSGWPAWVWVNEIEHMADKHQSEKFHLLGV